MSRFSHLQKIKQCVFRMEIRWALAKEIQRGNRKREKKNIIKEINNGFQGEPWYLCRRFLFFAFWYSMRRRSRCRVLRVIWKLQTLDFEFNWRTVEDRENPAELFPTKARRGVFGAVRLNVKFFPSISRPILQSFGEKLKNMPGTHARSRKSHARW